MTQFSFFPLFEAFHLGKRLLRNNWRRENLKKIVMESFYFPILLLDVCCVIFYFVWVRRNKNEGFSNILRLAFLKGL